MAVPKKKNSRTYIKDLLLRKEIFKKMNYYNILYCNFCKKKNLQKDFIKKTIFIKNKICIECIEKIKKNKKNIYI